MKPKLALPALMLMLAASLRAQSAPPTAGAPSPIGVWRGTSTCLVRPSACKDEVVVYRLSRANTADSVAFDARKIVGGQEEEMGVLLCRFTAANASLVCTMPQGTWRFRVSSDSLVGDLRLNDNTKFRDVRTARSH